MTCPGNWTVLNAVLYLTGLALSAVYLRGQVSSGLDVRADTA